MNLEDLFIEEYLSNKFSKNTFNHLSGKTDNIEFVHYNQSISSNSDLNENSNLEILSNKEVNEIKANLDNEINFDKIGIEFEFEQVKHNESIEIDFKFQENKTEIDESIQNDASIEQINQKEIIDFGFSEPSNNEIQIESEINFEENNEFENEVQNHIQQFDNEKYVEKILAAKKMLELNFDISKIEDITGIKMSEIEAYSNYLNSKNFIVNDKTEIELNKSKDSSLIENKVNNLENKDHQDLLIKDTTEKNDTSKKVIEVKAPNKESSNSFFDWLNELNNKESKVIESNNKEDFIANKTDNSHFNSSEYKSNSLEIEQQIHLNEIEYQSFDDKVNEFISSQIETKKKDVKGNPKRNTLNEIPDTSEFLSETIADLFLKQGYKDKAKSLYEKLIQRFPEKSTYFADKIKNCN